MPKSTHRRNGKPRPRRNNNPRPGPIFTHRGRKYRGVARLPDGYDTPTLEAHHPDDPATATLTLLRAALGDEQLEQISNAESSDDGTIDAEGITPLLEQVCAYYFPDMLASYVTTHLTGGRGAGS